MRRSDGAARERPSEHQLRDDDLIDQTIQPALDHIEYTPVAHVPVQRRHQHHSYAQESFDEAEMAKYVHFFIQTPYGYAF